MWLNDSQPVFTFCVGKTAILKSSLFPNKYLSQRQQPIICTVVWYLLHSLSRITARVDTSWENWVSPAALENRPNQQAGNMAVITTGSGWRKAAYVACHWCIAHRCPPVRILVAGILPSLAPFDTGTHVWDAARASASRLPAACRKDQVGIRRPPQVCGTRNRPTRGGIHARAVGPSPIQPPGIAMKWCQ